MNTYRQVTLAIIFLLTVLSHGMPLLAAGPSGQTAPADHQPPAEVEEISIVISPKAKRVVPTGTRIVIAEISGDFAEERCAAAVKDALLRRLIDNADYLILARDNLNGILLESNLQWGGQFNSNTAIKLGQLLGASFFIVGRVAYCGVSASDDPDNPLKGQYHILAALQIIDIESGKVIVSSSSEGKYIPRPAPYFNDTSATRAGRLASAQQAQQQSQDSAPVIQQMLDAGNKPLLEFDGGKLTDISLDSLKNRAIGALTNKAAEKLTEKLAQTKLGSKLFGDGEQLQVTTDISGGKSSVRIFYENDDEPDRLQLDEYDRRQAGSTATEPGDYALIKAAEQMANEFADKFFGRPMWEEVEMWKSTKWPYIDAIRYIRLGYGEQAVREIERIGATNLSIMSDKDVARYLHNYGVALLCANQPELAINKLRAAYRLSNSRVTLRMLGVASKLMEWALNVEINTEPEVQMLLARANTAGAGQANPTMKADAGTTGQATSIKN